MADAAPNHCGFAAIVGRPNVGKSTLLNRLLGQKLAITAPKPQTTRHTILGIKTVDAGQIIYVDTPGIHRRGDQALNRYLNRAAKAVVHDVDVVVMLIEALRWTDEDTEVLRTVARSNVPVILCINKVDKVSGKQELLPFIAKIAAKHAFAEIFPLSAIRGYNVQRLEEHVFQLLPEGPNQFADDQFTDRSERFLAAELIREQLTRRYGEELPYALSVEIERFEDCGGLYRIYGLIWVEKDGQKAIIIGARGEKLRESGRLARLEMEAMFGKKVFLTLWVKVKKSWSSDEQALERLGYSL